MRTNLVVAALLLLPVAGVDLLACGDKFLVVSRGTRFQRAKVARQPANILVYANPSTPVLKALEKADVDDTLRRAGYHPTMVSDRATLEQALRRGRWDLVIADLSDGGAVRTGLPSGTPAPMIVPVVYRGTGGEIAQAKKDYQRVLKGPIKSQAFLDAIDDALALRGKLLQAKSS